MSSIAVWEYYYISKSSDGNVLKMTVRVNQNLGITFWRLINMVCSAPHTILVWHTLNFIAFNECILIVHSMLWQTRKEVESLHIFMAHLYKMGSNIWLDD